MPKCIINGQEVEVRPGASIIEAFRQSGQSIAHYCYHPGLSVAGVCRLCMVAVEGQPRLQLACNTQVTEGMKINNTDEAVKEAVRWGMDFHLINHPLDCPICDQAGECGLQDQYMMYDRAPSKMSQPKVKKKKVVDLGPRVVLDSERCILCSRCVRFCDEVTKTSELGIFNRGDRAEISTFEGKPLNNNYSVNTVDICPVGALTSKNFRFRQRVWLLKEAESICTRCSTGCNIKISYNKEGIFRAKPRFNSDVNGHWMCDRGRDIEFMLNREHRLVDASIRTHGRPAEYLVPLRAAQKVTEWIADLKSSAHEKGTPTTAQSAALVLTGQYSCEEYQAIVQSFQAKIGSSRIYHWVNNPETFESFDGLLMRGDHNPNTKGLLQTLEKNQITALWKDLENAIDSGDIKLLVVAGPADRDSFPDLQAKLKMFSKVEMLVWLSPIQINEVDQLDNLKSSVIQIPVKSFVEKRGTYINYNGVSQQVDAVMNLVPQSLTLDEIAQVWSGDQNVIRRTSTAVGSNVATAAVTHPAAAAAAGAALTIKIESPEKMVQNELSLQRGNW